MKKFLTISFLFMFVLISTGIIFAQNSYTFKERDRSWLESPKVGETYDVCSTSNPNSAIKTIKVQIFKIRKSTDNRPIDIFGRLILFDQNGNKLFTGIKDEKSPSTAIYSDFGISTVVTLADIDNDGYTEIMIQAMQSDVRPQTFRVLKWKDGQLLKTKTGRLIKDSDGIFKWSKSNNHKVTWICRIKEGTDGKLYADFLGHDDGQGYTSGLVEIKPVEGGYKVVKTLKSKKI